MYQDFIQIKPSSRRLIPEDIVNHIHGLRKIADDWSRRYNPKADPPKFEFLVAGRTEDKPIRFLFRSVDEQYQDSLESQVRVSYPNSFEIERVWVDRAALHHPDPEPITPEQEQSDETGAYDHRPALRNSNLPDNQSPSPSDQANSTPSHQPLPSEENRDQQPHSPQTQAQGQYEPGYSTPSEPPQRQPTKQSEQRSQNRQNAQQSDTPELDDQSQSRDASSDDDNAQDQPSTDPHYTQQTLDDLRATEANESDELESDGGDADAVPMASTFKEFSLDTFRDCHAEAVHWYSRGERREDWQTLIERFTQVTKRQRQKEGTERRERSSPLGQVVDLFAKTEFPICLQVVFARRRHWGRKARRRQSKLEDNRDTLRGLIGATFDAFAGDTHHRQTPSPQSLPNEGQDNNSQVEEYGQDLGSRQQHIAAKGTSDCYRVNIRAVGFCLDSATPTKKQRLRSTMETLSNSFNHLSGQYYHITGKLTGQGSVRERLPKSRQMTTEQELKNFINATLQTTKVAKTRTQFTLNSDELANFIAVPSEKQLTNEAVRSIDSKEQTREPIKLPKMSILDNYLDNGIPLGYPLEENGEERHQPACMPPSLYNTHYLRSGATGQGKSVAINNELLAWATQTSGPNILIEPKGGDMAQNYLLTHKEVFGDIDDVIYFHAPEEIPAMPFFDLRPLLEVGYDRQSAIQDKLIQFDEIMRVVMGEDDYKSAKHSINFLKNAINAKFDGTYGKDAFTIAELRDMIFKMKTENKIPQVSTENDHVREAFEFLLDEPDQFAQIAQGAMNRLSILSTDQHLRKMLNHIPEWDEDKGTYVEHGFDLHDLIEEDKTIIFDLGDLRDSSQKAITLITLGYLWDALKHRTRRQEIQKEFTDPRSNDDDYTVTTILEEAKLFADTKMVEKFLAQGREFDLSLGLIMQFPDQANDNNIETDVYKEIIENVGVKVLGEMQIPEKIADMLASETINSDEYQNRLGQLPRGEWIVQMKGTEYFAEKPNPFHVHSLEPPIGHDASSESYSDEKKQEFGEGEYAERMNEVRVDYCVPDGAKDRDVDELSKQDTRNPSSPDKADEEHIAADIKSHESRFAVKSDTESDASPDQQDSGRDQHDTAEQSSTNSTPQSPHSSPPQSPTPREANGGSTEANSAETTNGPQSNPSETASAQPSSTASGENQPAPPTDTGKTNGTIPGDVSDNPLSDTTAESAPDSDSLMQGTPPANIDDLDMEQKPMGQQAPTSKDTYTTSNSDTVESDGGTTKTQPANADAEQQPTEPSEPAADRYDRSEQADAQSSTETHSQPETDSNKSNEQTPPTLSEIEAEQTDTDTTSPASTPDPDEIIITDDPEETRSGEETTEQTSHPPDQPDSPTPSAEADHTATDDDTGQSTSQGSGESHSPTSPSAPTEQSSSTSDTQDRDESHPEADGPAAMFTDTSSGTPDSNSPKQNEGERPIRDLVTDLPELSDATAEQQDALRELLATASRRKTLDEGLSLNDLAFLGFVYLAEARKLPGYSLLDSMTNLPGYQEADRDALVDAGYLVAGDLFLLNYFSTTPDARDLLDAKKPVGEGKGDLGEKTPHRAGVEYLAESMGDSANSDETRRYYEHSADTTFDVAVFNDTGKLARVGEVETGVSNAEAVLGDYRAMRATDASEYWAVPSVDTATKIVEIIQDQENDLMWVDTDSIYSWSDFDRQMNSNKPESTVPPTFIGFRKLRSLVDGERA